MKAKLILIIAILILAGCSAEDKQLTKQVGKILIEDDVTINVIYIF